ncbi:hypothetical protein [Actinokineospora cianjurensis]|uniref:Peptidase inhibitor family I36 n=1 Tax=Actinokineospora cianjurensis TaxID=585224 RepID=A0A421B4F5_9PSEU|nr:hypothetical protein [Actinokineospora cianjurensis]RLK59160.1 hypothetical protein CLV68_3644 [Actinokineospora cianjurensis]
MKGVRRIVVSLVVTGFAMTGTSVPQAAAATGIFLYYEFDGGLGIVNPDDDWCYRLGFTVRHLDNDTNRSVLVFPNDDCLGLPAATMRPFTRQDSPGLVSVLFRRGTSPRCVTVKDADSSPGSTSPDEGDRHCNG